LSRYSNGGELYIEVVFIDVNIILSRSSYWVCLYVGCS